MLAFVLGSLVENYLFISHLRYGVEWMLRPFPMFVWAVAAFMFGRPLIARSRRRDEAPKSQTAPAPLTGNERIADIVLWVGAAALYVYVITSSSAWELPARLMPQSLAVLGMVTILIYVIATRMTGTERVGLSSTGDTPSDREDVRRVGVQGLWLVGLVGAIAVIGMLPAIGLFVFAYMVAEGRMKSTRALLIALPFVAAVYMLFHETLHVPWPRSYIGDWIPGLRQFIGIRIL